MVSTNILDNEEDTIDGNLVNIGGVVGGKYGIGIIGISYEVRSGSDSAIQGRFTASAFGIRGRISIDEEGEYSFDLGLGGTVGVGTGISVFAGGRLEDKGFSSVVSASYTFAPNILGPIGVGGYVNFIMDGYTRTKQNIADDWEVTFGSEFGPLNTLAERARLEKAGELDELGELGDTGDGPEGKVYDINRDKQYDLNALSAAHDAVRDPRDNPYSSRNPSSALSQDSQYGEEGDLDLGLGYGFGYRDYDHAHNSANGFEGGNNGGGASNKENFCDGWANDNDFVEMDIIKQVSSNRLIYVNYVSYGCFLKH